MKRFLLDTHVVIWALSKRSRLSARTLRILDEGTNVGVTNVGECWRMLVTMLGSGLPFPVTARGDRREPIYRDDTDRRTHNTSIATPSQANVGVRSPISRHREG